MIDPIRDPSEYLSILKQRNSKLKYILLTHFHADFISGHHELHSLTGAEIVFGPNAKPDFEFHSAKDNERLKLGRIEI